MPVTVDTSQLDQLAADIGQAPENAGPAIYSSFVVSSARIKREWQSKLSGMPGVPHGALTITYDISTGITGPLGSILTALGVERLTGANQISSEIGAEDGRAQAPIVALEEYGSPENNLPPHGYGTQSLADEADDFANGLLIAIGDPLAGPSSSRQVFVPESSTTGTR